ncbi:MAG: zf-HC2 domain-containing protein [Verrucomicrobia bacterium]|nr:zf-HC2 domain-containing protein [Verrucomicrobiota bacterium]
MNHPTREDWMSYLYEETDAPARAELTAHLHNCPECQTALDGWRGTMTALQAWQLPAKSGRNETWRPFFKWGIAAALMLGTGFAFGKFAGAKALNMEQLRGALIPALRQELRRELNADVLAAFSESRAGLTNEFRQELRGRLDQWTTDSIAAANVETRRLLSEFAQNREIDQESDRQATLVALRKLDQQQRADYASLLQKVETVAVVAQGGFQETQNQIDQLAFYSQAKFSANK